MKPFRRRRSVVLVAALLVAACATESARHADLSAPNNDRYPAKSVPADEREEESTARSFPRTSVAKEREPSPSPKAADSRIENRTLEFSSVDLDGAAAEPRGENARRSGSEAVDQIRESHRVAKRRNAEEPAPEPSEERSHPQPLATTPILGSAHAPFPDTYFQHFGVNPTYETKERDTSTFATDVDTAAYTLARNYINHGVLPSDAAVRVEEFVNAFDYGYKAPQKDAIALSAEVFPSPNRRGYHILQIGLKAKEIEEDERKALHLVFVIDVSGSMQTDNRIGLVRESVKTLVQHLSDRDTVAIVSFSTRAEVELEPTSATDANRIFRALDGLSPGGSTNVESGLRLGYRLAASRLEDGGVHRVLLLSDGVANEGITEADAIFDTVREKVAQGITVTTIGVGLSNFNDVLLNRFAQVGKGNYFYIDGPEAARKVFVEQRVGTLEPVATDLKVQVIFDQKTVSRYRLLGYESRALKKRDFEDDRVAGGQVGAGHSVTAIYEIKLARQNASLGHVRFRCQTPGGWWPSTVDRDLPASIIRETWSDASPPARLALVAASFGEKLRGSYWARNLSWLQLGSMWNDIGEPLKLRRDVNELGTLIRDAGNLDRRGDPYERELPVAEMDFDRLPVLR